MKRILFFAVAMAYGLGTAYSQCLDWQLPDSVSSWTNFVSAGGAPCSDPPGASVTLPFGVWAAESYAMPNIRQGGTYVFDICQNFVPAGSGGWTPVFTILDENDDLVAFGRDSGSNCQLTFTATSTGTYRIVINRAGSANCGQLFQDAQGNNIDNGNPRITYNGGASCDPPVTDCIAGVLDDSETDSAICPGDVTSFDVIGMVVPNAPTIGGRGIEFVPGSSGSGGLGGTFVLTNIGGWPYSFDNDLNGALSFNGFPPLVGEWTMRPYVYGDAADVFDKCDSTDAVATVDFLPSSDPACGGLVCEAGSITSSDQSICPGDDWELFLDGEILPVPGDVLWFFLDTNDVSGDNDYIYNFGSDPSFYNFSGDLNGLLDQAELDVIAPGTYFVFAGIFNPLDTTVCSVTDNEIFINVLDENDPACVVVPPCSLPYPQVTGTTEVFQSNGVLLTWNPIPGSLGCQIQGGLASQSGTQTFQVLQNELSQFFVPQGQLNSGQTYRWRVRCGCSFTVAGPWTAYQNFTWNPGGSITTEPMGPMREASMTIEQDPTFVSPIAEAVPAFHNLMSVDGIYGNRIRMADVDNARELRKDKLGSIGAVHGITPELFEIFPNPSNGVVNLRYAAQKDGMLLVRVYDATGKVVVSENLGVNRGVNFNTFHLENLDGGMYLMEVLEGNQRFVERFVISK